MTKTSIEWTEETWNPTVGCSKVGSPGCQNCYAVDVAHRAMQPAHKGLTLREPGGRPDWTGEVRCLPERLDIPLRRRKPTLWFVDSMSDLFHPEVPVGFIRDVFTTMTLADRHTFQVLTKRPQRMAKVLNESWFWDGLAEAPPPNVWLGTSIESDPYTFRADHLRATPAAVRFLSCEPLLGPLLSLDLSGIDWVIAGGESGPGARPTHPDWVRDLRDQCDVAGIPFLFKQWGAWSPVLDQPRSGDHIVTCRDHRRWEALYDGYMGRVGDGFHITPGQPIMRRLGKKAAGRILDGRTWDGMPEVRR